MQCQIVQADEHCKLSKDLQIVGYYQANELAEDMELGAFGKKIAEKLRAHCPHAAILLVSHSVWAGGKPRIAPTPRDRIPHTADGRYQDAADGERPATSVDRYRGKT